jgi:hypothetical protein
MDTVGHLTLTKKIKETFPPLTSAMSQDFTRQQSASQLRTKSENIWTFSINVTFPSRTHFALLNPTEFRHYRVTCVTLLPSLVLVLGLAAVWLLLYTLPLAVGKLLNKGPELLYY